MIYIIKVFFLISTFFFLPSLTIVNAAVVINEFQVEPSTSQWVEILNTGPDVKDISGWFVDDNGGSEKFSIPSGTVLQANFCVTFESGKFNWNTSSSDSAQLLDGSTVIDEFFFAVSPGNGVSFGRSPDGTGGWTTFTSPSRDRFNATGVVCLAPTPTPTPTSTPTKTPTPTPTKTPTPTPTSPPTPTPTKSSSSTKTPTPTKKATPTPTKTAAGSVLGALESGSPSATELNGLEDTSEGSESSASATGRSLKPLILSLVLVALGLALLSIAYVWKKRASSLLEP